MRRYVNKKCRGISKSIKWDKPIAKKRWTAMLDGCCIFFLL